MCIKDYSPDTYHILSKMVCKHKSEWSYKWEKIEKDARAFYNYHYPKAKEKEIKERLDELKLKYDAMYDFWDKLNFKTDTFWYFEPFAWVTQMMKIFKWDFKNEEDGWPVKLSYICVFFLKRSSISFGFFFHS